MLFNSYIFILFFLPFALIGYYGLNHFGKETSAKIFLIIMSLWFYAYFNYSYVFIIFTSIGCNYALSKLLTVDKITRTHRKTILILGITINIAVIFYFKYFNFFIENINLIFRGSIVIEKILMPLGISFFTFQQISYLVDSYRVETKKYSFIDYALFVTFFPQLVAGPIVFHDEIIPQFNEPKRKKINQYKFAKGLWLMAIGLFKKVLIADTLAPGVNFGFENIDLLSMPNAWLVVLCYTLQIYFDFSGYCNMAVGIANLFHIDLPINFNSPYKADSVTAFWKRWHITLTRFLTKYVYIPLGGNRKGLVRTLLNIMFVYLLSGVWHGAAWTFIVWGIMHGAARIFEKIAWKWLECIPKCIKGILTFIFINLTWVMFRAVNIKDAFKMYQKMFTHGTPVLHATFLEQFDVMELTYMEEHLGVIRNVVDKCPWINMAIILIVSLFIVFGTKNCHEKEFKPTIWNALGTVILLLWTVLSLSGISEFLYFNF